jgi:hypothetical protein
MKVGCCTAAYPYEYVFFQMFGVYRAVLFHEIENLWIFFLDAEEAGIRKSSIINCSIVYQTLILREIEKLNCYRAGFVT